MSPAGGGRAGPHRLVEVVLHRLRMPLVRQFRTSLAVEDHRDLLVLEWRTERATGWSECAADRLPVYFAETAGGVELLLDTLLLTTATGAPDADALHRSLAAVPGNPLAKAFVETAVLDAELRAAGESLAHRLGATADRVPVGVSVGIADSTDELCRWVEDYLGDGYQRVKLKIRPGWDVEPVRAVRRAFGDQVVLQVDANQAYHPAEPAALLRLDDEGLLLIEQPFAADDLVAHARLAERLRTPVCLDESIRCPQDALTAIELGAAAVVNVKPARVGGYLAARELHDLCLARSVPVWCGGVLETGIGRAANLALAALPGFTLPGDISATSRYYRPDVTQSFELRNGYLDVPAGPGTGAEVDRDRLTAVTVSRRVLHPVTG